MIKRNLIKAIIITSIISILTTACNMPDNQKGEAKEGNELHVAAAASLRFVFEEIGLLFEEDSGTKVVFQFGSTGNLAQQIKNGAPIDLFVAADKKTVEELAENGDIVEETKAVYAIGRIVLAMHKNSNLNIKSLEDLLSEEIEYIAIANPNHAPYGLAGKEVLENKGLWELVKDKIVYGENISQTMQFIQTGNAQAGIIALAIADVEEIEYLLIDDELHSPLEKMLGVVSHSNNKELAKSFATFVKSPEGREIMQKYGFYLP